MDKPAHISVLPKEAVDALVVDTEGIYVDGTFGRGGHSAEILARLSSRGRLIGIDKDMSAIEEAERRFGHDERFLIKHGSFCSMQHWLADMALGGKVDGVLLDLGVSSPQLDEAHRGFSFMQDGPLDMRMNTTQGQTAAEWLARCSHEELSRVCKEYGEERYAKRIARAVIAERERKPIVTTAHLADVVSAANPAWEKGKHPATRVFQAIRIFINNELQELDDVLQQALDALSVGGRLVVISFHSLEDRRVKQFIRKQVLGDELPPGLPVTEDALNRRLRKIGKAIKASQDELQHNPRARSAVMRVAEKLV